LKPNQPQNQFVYPRNLSESVVLKNNCTRLNKIKDKSTLKPNKPQNQFLYPRNSLYFSVVSLSESVVLKNNCTRLNKIKDKIKMYLET